MYLFIMKTLEYVCNTSAIIIQCTYLQCTSQPLISLVLMICALNKYISSKKQVQFNLSKPNPRRTAPIVRFSQCLIFRATVCVKYSWIRIYVHVSVHPI